MRFFFIIYNPSTEEPTSSIEKEQAIQWKKEQGQYDNNLNIEPHEAQL
jgi:hypothetical protein